MAGEIGKLGDEFKKKFNDDFYTLAHATTRSRCSRSAMAKAKSTDPVKVGARDGRPAGSRASTATSRCASPTTSCSSRCTSPCGRRPTRRTRTTRREHRLQLPDRSKYYDAYVVEHADVVPDEAPGRAVMRAARAGRIRLVRARPAGAATSGGPFRRPATVTIAPRGPDPHQRAERRQLRAAAVHAQLGPDADLQHDGRAELRARQLLHARRVRRLHADRPRRLLAGAGRGAAGGRRCSARVFERYGAARACTSSATCPSC